MCHLTDRTSKPPSVLLDPKSIQREEPISIAPATEALALFSSLPQKRKLPSAVDTPAFKLRKPNSITNNEKTLLDAARSGNLQSLQYFLSTDDCDINKSEPILGNTALHLAVSNNHLPFVQILLQNKEINVDIVNRNGSSPLLLAIDYGHSALVRLLISAGASVKQADKQGFTALHKAVLTGNMEILRFLVASDKSALDAPTAEQRLTPLHQAAFHGKTAAMKILLAADALVSPLSSNGTTPLHMAALKNHPKAMSLLLRKGADPDVQDNHKRTPLHYACLFGHIDAASVLCDAKCSVYIKDFKTNTPLALAAGSGLEDLLKVLVSHVGQNSS